MKRQEAENLVYDADDNGQGVSDWEADFIDSIIKSLEDPQWSPSDKQLKKLKEIHQRCVN